MIWTVFERLAALCAVLWPPAPDPPKAVDWTEPPRWAKALSSGWTDMDEEGNVAQGFGPTPLGMSPEAWRQYVLAEDEDAMAPARTEDEE